MHSTCEGHGKAENGKLKETSFYPRLPWGNCQAVCTGFKGLRLWTFNGSRPNWKSMAQEEFEEIVDAFDYLEEWQDRYRHVIEMGKAMPPLDEALKVPATKVEGCASQVWLVPNVEGMGATAIFTFEGESDAVIVRGLIAVLKALFSGLSVREILDIDARAELNRLGLEEHLTSQRSNGLRSMVKRIRELASRAGGKQDALSS